MKRVRPFVALVLLFCWGTVTVHCGLEVDGLFGAASSHAKSNGQPTPLDSDADPDGCGAIEAGHFDSFVAGFTIVAPAVHEWIFVSGV